MMIFIYDQWLDPSSRQALKLPLTFIGFAYIESALYIMRSKDKARNFWNVYYGATDNLFNLTKTKTFGALYYLDMSALNIRYLDANYGCSMSSLGKNHEYDLYHRKTLNARIIKPTSIDNMLKEFYFVESEIEAICYIANEAHPKFANRIRNQRFKVKSCMHEDAMRTQYEVTAKESEETSED